MEIFFFRNEVIPPQTIPKITIRTTESNLKDINRIHSILQQQIIRRTFDFSIITQTNTKSTSEKPLLEPLQELQLQNQIEAFTHHNKERTPKSIERFKLKQIKELQLKNEVFHLLIEF